MSADPPIREGFVPFRGHRTWYRVVGAGEAPGKLPLILLNGGPGAPHDYFEPLAEWARAGRRIVFYDQLGSGASDHPHDPSLWTVELFVAELRALREALGLAHCHLLGQSWGGLLALEHALAHPPGVASLTLADPLVSTPQWEAEADRLRTGLPADVQAALTRHEAAGTTDSAEYQEAMMVYYARHVCRLDPWPECLLRAYARLGADPEVYNTMWGSSEYDHPLPSGCAFSLRIDERREGAHGAPCAPGPPGPPGGVVRIGKIRNGPFLILPIRDMPAARPPHQSRPAARCGCGSRRGGVARAAGVAGSRPRARLTGIAAPALVLGGRYDECTPAIQEDLHRRLPGSEWTVFERSAHLPHLEEPERFREVVEAFLERVERVAA